MQAIEFIERLMTWRLCRRSITLPIVFFFFFIYRLIFSIIQGFDTDPESYIIYERVLYKCNPIRRLRAYSSVNSRFTKLKRNLSLSLQLSRIEKTQ